MSTLNHQTPPRAFRALLRSSSLIGGAAAVNVVIGLVRAKTAALLLGPTGFGIMSLLLNLAQTGAAVCGLGLNTAAVTDIAAAAGRGDVAAERAARRTLAVGLALLTVVATVGFWLARDVVAAHVLGDGALAWMVAPMGFAAALMMISTGQLAVLNGFHRVGDIVRVQIAGALLSTLLGTAALVAMGRRGILVYVLTASAGSVVVGAHYVRRLARVPGGWNLRILSANLIGMVRRGVPLMLGSISMIVAVLAVRTIVARALGAAELGQFAAAWTISMTYAAFVLQAMAFDYFPRLSAVVDTPAAARPVIDNQIEIALLLATPILLAVEATAPWLIRLLYADAFVAASDVLRWQVLGDVFRIVAWPLSFVAVTRRRAKTYLLVEAGCGALFVLSVWLGIGALGLVVTGIGFVAAHAFQLALALWVAHRLVGYRPSPAVAAIALAACLGVGAVMACGLRSDLLGLVVGAALSVAAVAAAAWRLHHHRALTLAMPERLRRYLPRPTAP